MLSASQANARNAFCRVGIDGCDSCFDETIELRRLE